MSALAVFFCSVGSSRASTVGLDNTTGSFSLWDLYSSLVFSGKAPDSSNTSLFSATLASNEPNGILISGDRIYSGGKGFDLDITGTATGTITTLSLQLKFTAPGNTTSAAYFTASLNNVLQTPGTLLGTVVDGQSYSLVQYTWTGISIPNGSTFTIALDAPNDNVSLDTVRLTQAPQLAAVPEPGAVGLIGGAGLVFLMRRRRPQVAA